MNNCENIKNYEIEKNQSENLKNYQSVEIREDCAVLMKKNSNEREFEKRMIPL